MLTCRCTLLRWLEQCIHLHILYCGSLTVQENFYQKKKGTSHFPHLQALFSQGIEPSPQGSWSCLQTQLRWSIYRKRALHHGAVSSAFLEPLLSLYEPIPDHLVKLTKSFFLILRAPHSPPPSPPTATVFAPVLILFESHVGISWTGRLHGATSEAIWENSSLCELSCRNQTHKYVRNSP